MKTQLKNGDNHETDISITGLSLSVLLSACAAARGGGDVDRGRQDLLAGNNKAALGYFQQAEQADPTDTTVLSYGKEYEFFRQDPIPHWGLSAGAPDFTEGAFSAPER